eukprot:99069_1
MMLPLFCLFLIINIAITHSNPIINCDTNEDCYIECIDPQSCQNTIITCPTTGKCDIKCQGNESCNNATIIATQSIGDFNLLCSSDPFEYNGNCKNITVYGSETTTNSPYDFTITCDQNEQSCAYSTIHCPKHSNCNIHCHNTESCKNITINAPINNDLYIHCNGSSSCYDSTINAQYSSLLNITGCIKHDSCLYLSMHCPPHSNRHKNCYIEGNNNLNGIEIYAINGWNDIQITHIGNNSMQHFGTMYCTNDMSIQCDISNNNWLCNNSNDYCNNIITTTKYTQLIVNTPSNPSQDIISTLTSIILMNDNGPILNKQENNHLFSIHISVETIIMFSGSMILLLVCIIGSCCIYKLHRKYNQEKYKKESIDIIHKINKINIPISDNNTPTTPTTQNTTHYHHTNSSFGGQIIFGQSTPSISNNASNTNFNLSIPSINENRNRNPYKSQRLKANTIDITHSVHENNLSHVYNMKKRHPSVDAYTPNNEIQFVNVVRNGLHNVINRSSSSLVPPILNNSSGSGSGSDDDSDDDTAIVSVSSNDDNDVDDNAMANDGELKPANMLVSGVNQYGFYVIGVVIFAAILH